MFNWFRKEKLFQQLKEITKPERIPVIGEKWTLKNDDGCPWSREGTQGS